MFERYTQSARQSVFHARFAASQFGGDHIDTEHLLLGVLRGDPPLALRLFKTPENIDSVRDEIEKQLPRREKNSTSADFPLSHTCKRVLARAAGEAARLNHGHISPGHLLLGLLMEQESIASGIMTAHGLTAPQVQQELSHSPEAETSSRPGIGAKISELMSGLRGPRAVPPVENYQDLTAAARNNKLSPLIGREKELESIIRILSRRNRHNPVLIGEPGVGKTALVHGLAQRIADGAVPADLAGRVILSMDAASLLSLGQNEGLPGTAERPNAILFIHGLFDLPSQGSGWDVMEAVQALEPKLAGGAMQCIATGTALGLRTMCLKSASLARLFEVVAVLPPGEEEAVRIVTGVKDQYEKFHGVVITQEAVETSVSASRWFLRHRQLPDRAIDLIDEASAAVKLHGAREPLEIAKIHKRIHQIVQEMEKAIATHDFEKARSCSNDERKERENLRIARERLKPQQTGSIVSAEDIVQAVAGRAAVTPAAVKSVMQAKDTGRMERVAAELAAQIPLGGREWAEALVAHLAGCSADEAEKVAQAIRAARGQLE
jgi:ATP-dependent Clp protease ATP-binding subunit ClpC